MNRRSFVIAVAALALEPWAGRVVRAESERERIVKTEEAWRALLSPEQFRILRSEGTERPWTSELLDEKRPGLYHCVGCDQPLFSSETKYDSRTGWPSFYDVLDGAIGTKKDYKLIIPRTEYHCSLCGGHHGHVFKDGPKPTGLRYCNNGAVLRFVPA